MSNEKLSRSEAKDIATVMMAIHARYIDAEAWKTISYNDILNNNLNNEQIGKQRKIFK